MDKYTDESLCVVFVCDGGERMILSANLSGQGLVAPSEKHFFVKDYSESEGLADGIERAGFAEVLARYTFGSFDASACLMVLV